MGYGAILLTRGFGGILFVCVCFLSVGARPRKNSFNVTRDWKRELADKEGYFTNTWAVEIDPAEEHVVAQIAKRHGFSIIGKVGC